ncbi:hypothetical protein [Pseudoalteromonas xiamenensis]
MKNRIPLIALLATSFNLYANNEATLMQNVSDACGGIKKPDWSANMLHAAASTIKEQLSRIETYQTAKEELSKIAPNYMQSSASVIFEYKNGVPFKTIIPDCDQRVSSLQNGIKLRDTQIAAKKQKIKQDEADRIEKERLKEQALTEQAEKLAAQKQEIAENAGYSNFLGSFEEVRVKLIDGMSMSDFSEYLVIPEDGDRYRLVNVTGDYAIYVGSDWGSATQRKIALLKEPNGFYERNGTLPNKNFILVDTQEFSNIFTGNQQIPVFIQSDGAYVSSLGDSGSSGGFWGWIFLFALAGVAFKFKDQIIAKANELKPLAENLRKNQ